MDYDSLGTSRRSRIDKGLELPFGIAIKYTQKFPAIAQWHRLGYDRLAAADPAAGCDLDTFIEVQIAFRQLYREPAVVKLRDRAYAPRDIVQDGLEAGVEFNTVEKYQRLLNTYGRLKSDGSLDQLDIVMRWMIDTIVRVAMEPGVRGGPRVEIAHDLMVDLIEAGGGPRFDYWAVWRASRKLADLPDFHVTQGRGKKGTKYEVALSGSSELPQHLRDQWLFARSDSRPEGMVELLGTSIPLLSVAQFEAFRRYLHGDSPAKARRLAQKVEHAGEQITPAPSARPVDLGLSWLDPPLPVARPAARRPGPVNAPSKTFAEVLRMLDGEPDQSEQETNMDTPKVSEDTQTANEETCLFGHGDEFMFAFEAPSGGWSAYRCVLCWMEPPDAARWQPESVENGSEVSG